MLSLRFTLASLAALLLAFLTLGPSFCVFAVTEADAKSTIVATENKVVECYRALSAAEKTGANITGLLSILNEAGELLSKADLAYSMRHFDSACDFATRSQEKLNGFVVEADALRETAMQERYWDFMVNVVGSIVGALGVVCGGLVIWLLLDRRSQKKQGV